MVELSALLSAVKPKDLSDQYKVLSALYVLNAHIQPATARQVADALKLPLGADTPKNIPGKLRKYKAYATPKVQGPPLLWSLTKKGVEHLRTLSGLTLTTLRKEEFDSDIGIVCALQSPELEAVLAACGGASAWSEVGDARFTHVYRETRIKTSDSKSLRVIATTSTSMGLTAAAIATTHLVHQFRPRIVVMVGIAAGTRSGNKQFGDVLVADPSVDYNSGKIAMVNGVRELLPDPYPIGLNPRLRSLLQKYRGHHVVFKEIWNRWPDSKPPPCWAGWSRRSSHRRSNARH